MIYLYECKFCGEFDVVKPYNRAAIEETCPNCYSEMKKRVTAVKGFVGTFVPGFNYALGASFESKRAQDEHIKKIEYTTGKKLVEVGNDKLNIKPEIKPFPREEAIRELTNRWQRS